MPVATAWAAEANLLMTGTTTTRVGDTFVVRVRGSELESIDTIRLNGKFTPGLVAWDHAAPQGIFQNVSPGTFVDNKAGSFSFGAYSFDEISAAGDLVTLYFTALRPGKAEIQLDQTTRVYQNGVEQALTRTPLEVTILPASPAETRALRVQSSSHPDGSRWYTQRVVDLNWTVTSNQTYKTYVGLDAIPNGVADRETTGNMQRLEAPADGIWYAHVKLVYANGKSEQVNLPIRIDTIAPLPLQPVVETMRTNQDQADVLRFSTLDNGSGMSRYEIFVDDVLVTSTAMQSVFLGGLRAGDRVVRVVAYDQAGNSTSASLIYQAPGQVAAGGLRTGFVWWRWWWILLLILLLILLIARRQYILKKRTTKLVSKGFSKKKK